MIHALIEVDISDVRKALRSLRKRKRSNVSMIGYIVDCNARAVGKNRWMHAYKDYRNRLIAFEDVDVSTTIERKINRQKMSPWKKLKYISRFINA